MLKLSGVLTIRTIDGRNGPFNVGRLVTDLGEFSVKETILDQYEQGKYEGDFGISRIYPAYYVAGGRLVVEVRATLETMALAGIDALSPDDVAPVAEPDPIEENAATTTEQPAAEDRTPVSSDVDPDETLFGELWPLGTRVKLDPTVDRTRFRRQKEQLKLLGYQFQPLGQYWEQPSRDEAA